MKLKLLALTLCLLFVLPALAAPPCETYKNLGDATYTPNTLTTFATTPDTGVVAPSGTVRVVIDVQNYPIRWLVGSTNPTASRGNIIPAGASWIITDPSWPALFKFIDTSSGASTVNIQWLGYNCASGVNQ